MKLFSVMLLLLATSIFGSAILFSADFPEPLRMNDPLFGTIQDFEAARPETWLAKGGSAEFEWNYHGLASTPEEIWNLHVGASFNAMWSISCAFG